jgi:hypothetical protein
MARLVFRLQATVSTARARFRLDIRVALAVTLAAALALVAGAREVEMRTTAAVGLIAALGICSGCGTLARVRAEPAGAAARYSGTPREFGSWMIAQGTEWFPPTGWVTHHPGEVWGGAGVVEVETRLHGVISSQLVALWTATAETESVFRLEYRVAGPFPYTGSRLWRSDPAEAMQAIDTYFGPRLDAP